MSTDRNKTRNGAAQRSTNYAQRVHAASQDYRVRLQEKAASMRTAVLEGETTDERVLAVAEALERLAGNKN